MSDTTETRWFKIVTLVAAGFFSGLFIANVIYYNRLRNGGNVTKGEATAMLWINGILLVIAIILFVWALVRLVAPEGAKEKTISYLKSTESVIPYGRANIIVSP